jgi:hypothetical protein
VSYQPLSLVEISWPSLCTDGLSTTCSSHYRWRDVHGLICISNFAHPLINII